MKTTSLTILGVAALLLVGCATQSSGQAAAGDMKMAKMGCKCDCPMMKQAAPAEDKKCDMMTKHDHAKDAKAADSAKPADGAVDHSQHQH